APIPPLPRQKRFTVPVTKEMRDPVSETDELSHRTIVCFGYLTAPVLEQDEVLALTLLDSILMETDASLLKAPLIDSKLCIHVDAFIDVEMSEVPYVIAFKGCDPENVDALEKLLKKSLEEIVQKGLSAELIDAAIHQLEFSRLEITGDHAPFGLTLFMRAALAKQHGCDPENALEIHSLFEKLLLKVKDPAYLTGLIQKHFLDNSHKVRLVMHPDRALHNEEIESEKKKLQGIKQALSEKQIEEILKQAHDLSVYQKHTEAQSLDCLPKLTLDDVNPIVRDLPLKHHPLGKNLDIYHHDCFTNYVVYADLIFDLPEISDEDLPYVHLLCSLIPELGSGNRTYTQNLEYLQAHTGGIAASCALHLQTADPKTCRPSFTLRGKCLDRKVDKLLPLMHDTLLAPRLDEKKRIEELLLQLRDSQLSRLNRQAMRYAIHLALSGFSPASYVTEAWYGLRYYKTIESITQDLKKNLPKLIDKLQEIKKHLFSFHAPHLVLSCSKEMLHTIEKERAYGLADLPQPAKFNPWKVDYDLPTIVSQARTIPSHVSFTVEGFKSVHFLHPLAPALTIAAVLFDNLVLHKKVREQGGAYGCGATFSSSLGFFHFHSYRDPHLASTLQTFEEAIDFIAAGNFTAQDLEEAKLGIIQQFDTPISPGSRALTAYSWMRDGKTTQMRQDFRNRLLALTPADIKHAVVTELLPKKKQGIIVAMADKELLEKENAQLAANGVTLPIYPI
ncbi:MAG: insulinase family protein, partial [Candidatus Melainabacteria bacterium]|nr:insulinase family protein [Candidatus Melainabacteria bacterium]